MSVTDACRALPSSQHLVEQLVAAEQDARQVEEALPAVGLGGPDGLAVAVQVAVPLAVFRIGEMGEGVLVDLLVPLPEVLPAGERPAQQQGVERFAVRPPELQVGPQLVRRRPVDVGDVLQSAVLPIPAMLQRGQHDVDGGLHQVAGRRVCGRSP